MLLLSLFVWLVYVMHPRYSFFKQYWGVCLEPWPNQIYINYTHKIAPRPIHLL